MNTKIFLLGAGVLATSFALLVACSDSGTGSSSGNPFTPGGQDSGPSTSSGQPDSSADTGTGCPNKPAGCFCGTPTTQAQFLNRCTSSAALPVNLTVKAATTADIP